VRVNPYRVLYRLGITPWERAEVPAPVVRLSETFDAPGRALDVGCGTGRDAVYLAQRGWAVTGVDGVPQALDGARERGQRAGVEVKWILGDVTRLEGLLPAGELFTFVLDRGCFHGLSEQERARCAEGITSATSPGSRLLMLAFQPRRLGLGPRGITREQLERHFAGAWRLTSSEGESESQLPFWIGDAKPVWYELERQAV
jgi:SAM-dependent methyltransferase